MRRLAPVLLCLVGLAAASIACRLAPRSPLDRAAAEGDLAAIDRLVSQGARLDSGGGRGVSPLIWAARNGQVAAIRRLVRLGASPDLPGGVNGWTPVEHALHKGQTAAALALLDLGANVQGSKGLRPLALAAGYGNATLVEALIARGADPTLDLGGGPSLVGLAAAGAWDIDYRFSGCDRHTRTVQTLLKAAPDLRLTNSIWDRLAARYVRSHGCQGILDQLALR
jgi:ankyrin repeat protein